MSSPSTGRAFDSSIDRNRLGGKAKQAPLAKIEPNVLTNVRNSSKICATLDAAHNKNRRISSIGTPGNSAIAIVSAPSLSFLRHRYFFCATTTATTQEIFRVAAAAAATSAE